ncbi:response regulator [Cohnella zeiphila]|uniref:Response regulator n=1 Tax=Cohnella zeiphila TaxID=2761120 RepID=A0A7X0VTF8_9BACL|nr:response regulator [Cohnella zeiphila]MBB6729891.1 response regulator [Cohnella zeiphila]
MIRVVAVDDEPPALKRVEKLLRAKADVVQIGGLFDSSKQFWEHVLTSAEPIDLALLDMEMPGLHGLELAKRLREVRPEIQIAFLTAYEEYARDAFDVEALDYLLKPITDADLARTFDRFAKRSGRGASLPVAEPKLSVRSFGPFSVTTDRGEAVRFRNSKSRELLAYLHHAGGKPVGKAQIMNDIWQGKDVERTQVNLHSTVYQLRKDLEACGLHGVVEQTKTAGGGYGLRWPVAVGDDVAEYEAALRQYGSTKSMTPLIRAIQLYGEGFLAGSGYGWAAPRQAELELSYAELLEAMVGAYIRLQRYEIALDPMRKWVHLQPLEERLHAKMVALLLMMDREDDARKYYRLAAESLEPSDESALPDFSRLLADPSAFF